MIRFLRQPFPRHVNNCNGSLLQIKHRLIVCWGYVTWKYISSIQRKDSYSNLHHVPIKFSSELKLKLWSRLPDLINEKGWRTVKPGKPSYTLDVCLLIQIQRQETILNSWIAKCGRPEGPWRRAQEEQDATVRTFAFNTPTIYLRWYTKLMNRLSKIQNHLVMHSGGALRSTATSVHIMNDAFYIYGCFFLCSLASPVRALRSPFAQSLV